MDTILLGGLMLILWPLSVVAGKRVPERGKLFLLLFLAFVSAMRVAWLVTAGGITVPSVVFVVLTAVFILGAVRQQRRMAPKAGG